MFDSGFATLFRAVSRIRVQLERADPEFRQVLAEELDCLRRLGDQYIDHWMSLDEQIDELFETYQLPRAIESPQFHAAVSAQGAVPWSFTAESSDEGMEPDWPGDRFPPRIPLQPFPTSTSTSEPAEDGLGVEDLDLLHVELTDATLTTFRQGMAYYDLLMFDHASDALERVVQVEDNTIARLYLGAAHAARGRYDEAMVEVGRARSTATHDVVVCATYEVEAQVHLAQQNAAEAIRCLETIIGRKPDYKDVWYNLGVCLAFENDFGHAELAFRRVLQENQRDPMAYIGLARAQLAEGKADEAMDTCKTGLTLFPRNVHLRHVLSQVFEQQGELRQSIDVERAIAEHLPSCMWVWNRLAWLLAKDGRIEDAIALLKKPATLKPDDTSVTLQLGVLHLLSGHLDKSEEVLTSLQMDASHQPIVWIALGRISAKRGDIGKAYARFLRAIRDERKPVRRLALYYYGLSLSEQGQLDDAEKYLKASLHLGSSNPSILLALATVAERTGRPLEANKYRIRAKNA